MQSTTEHDLEGCNLASGNFDCLLHKVKNLEKAHRKCRSVNKRFDAIVNVMILLTSAAVTSLESLLDITRHEYHVTIAKICLSGVTTFLASLNMTFDNASKAASHHEVSRLYMELSVKIIQAQLVEHDPMSYQELLTQFSEIRRDSIGLFGFVSKRYNIS